MYDIVLFDIVGFSQRSDNERKNISSALIEYIKLFFETQNYLSNDTGDGYYIALEYNDSSLEQICSFVCGLIARFDDDVDFRFALTHDSINILDGLNNTIKLDGSSLIELARILSAYKSGNIILITDKFYNYYIAGNNTNEQEVCENIKILVYNKNAIIDKHANNIQLHSIGIVKDANYFGAEVDDGDIMEDEINHDDFKKILENSFNGSKIIELSKPIKIDTNKRKIVIYSYFRVKSHFYEFDILFLSNRINNSSFAPRPSKILCKFS